MRNKLALAAVCMFFVAANASAAELHLRREAKPAGALVSLGDIAEILTNDAAEAGHLAKLELFPAPTSGSSRLVRASEVRDTLAQRGVDLRQIRFVGSSSIWIHGGHTEKAAAEKVVAVKTAPPMVVPAAAYEPAIPTTPVVVSLRPLQRGMVIRASDVQLQSRQGDIALSAAMNIEDVVGRQVVRPIAAGATVPLVDLQSPELVAKNEVVTVYARTRGVQVRTSAKALEAGAKDDIIVLESLLDRNAHFTARVIGTKEVEVLAGAPLAASPAARPAPAASASPATQPRGSVFGLRVSDNDSTQRAAQ